jgi:hypothetical protein
MTTPPSLELLLRSCYTRDITHMLLLNCSIVTYNHCRGVMWCNDLMGQGAGSRNCLFEKEFEVA